jgi:taurine transport system permease protein
VVILGIIVIAIVSISMELLLRLIQRIAAPWQGHG